MLIPTGASGQNLPESVLSEQGVERFLEGF